MSGAEEPASPTAKSADVDFRARTLRGRPRAVVRFVLEGLFRVLIGFRVSGLEHVPPSGPLIVAGNHLHNADPVLIEVAFPRQLQYMAKKELFSTPVVSWVVRIIGCFPVDRARTDRSAIRNAEARLRQGIPIGMFPEGTRSVTRSLKSALPGAAAIAQLSGAPILPVAITGSERLPFNGAKGRLGDRPRPKGGRRGVQVRFGEPFTIPREIDGRRLTHEEATERLMAALVALLPPEYHGVYAHLAALDRNNQGAQAGSD